MQLWEAGGLAPLGLFLLAVINYFLVVNLIDEQYLYLIAIVKVLPIAALYRFTQNQNNSTRQKRIVYLKNGLLFSGIGDVCLVWPQFFLCGLVSFSIAHCCYIRYFEIRQRNYILGLFLFVIDGAILFVVYPTFVGSATVAIPFYSFLLVSMLWRSCDQMNDPFVTRSWSVCGAVGGILFTISDLLLLINMFVHHKPVFHILTMATYYCGQLAIALNVLK